MQFLIHSSYAYSQFSLFIIQVLHLNQELVESLPLPAGGLVASKMRKAML